MKYLITIVLAGVFSFGAYAQEGGSSHAIALSEREKPRYPGGDSELKKYLSLNLRYPNLALEQKIEGEVVIGFAINVDGSISDIKILKGMGYGCDEEAIRVIKAMPEWQPARMKGKTIRVVYTLPVVFELPSSQEQSQR